MITGKDIVERSPIITENPLKKAMIIGERPLFNKYAIITEPNDKTLKYKRDIAIEVRNSGLLIKLFNEVGAAFKLGGVGSINGLLLKVWLRGRLQAKTVSKDFF
jgi:ribosomal protein L17